MTKPVTPQEMFDLWQKMVNPGAFPLQSLMFPVLDAAEIDKKISELETVEHWIKANLNMLQLSIKSLEYQRAMLRGGKKAAAAMQGGDGVEDTPPNPALWAWNMMAQAGKDAMDSMEKASGAAASGAAPKKRRAKKASAK